ncbi:hypothetical protein E2C01_007720 [Portunus trituberculatus]|uniref:Endonuclease/exonuclease/phosphatase domain-containing protein n=1 Tax=Portunus trituberculatus TaxID=210409 RepID=A0A5B7CZQ7_PORTR|nr:hypothetical protein [Portunus trituberculatus]
MQINDTKLTEKNSSMDPKSTIFRENDTPSRLDLIFAKDHINIEEMKYKTPIGKSDHVLVYLQTTENCPSTRKETYKNKCLDYSRTNFKQLTKYFVDVDWNTALQARDIEEKWNTFLDMYNRWIEMSTKEVNREHI